MAASSSVLAAGISGRAAGHRTRGITVGLVTIVAGAMLVLGASAMRSAQQVPAPTADAPRVGQAAPMTSSIERAIESGALATSAAGITATPRSELIESRTTGLTARVPGADSSLERALMPALTTASIGVPTVVVTTSSGLNHRAPAS